MEKDYIIISTVRSNLSGKIGFLSETKRLNVALTRAKKGVIVLGSAECLAKKNGIWRDFVSFYYSKNLIFQGPLSNLVPVPKDEIFITDIESDQEEECEIIKIEKHKEMKKEIICDYFKSWDAAPPAPAAKNEIKNDIKEYDEIIIEHKSTAEEEKEDEEDIKDWKIKKNKNKNKKKNSNKNSEEEEEEKKVVEEKKNANNKKIRKEKESKNTIVTEIKEDRKNKKKWNKKYLDESSSDNDEKKSKKKGKNKRK